MSAAAATTTSQKLEVWGPNLRTTDEQIHVHAAGCADTKRGIYRGAEAPSVSDFTTQREVVEFVYPPADFEYDADTEWEGFAGDVRFFPCCGDLPAQA
jgi:hypothetical protein